MPVLSSEVGSYDVIIPFTFTKGDKSFTANIPYSYTVQPAVLEAKVNNVSRTYGESNPNFVITYSGFVQGDDESIIQTAPTASTNATETSDVGAYPITLSGGVAPNYIFKYVEGKLTINKAPLLIQVKDSQKTYGDMNPTFGLEYSGLKNNATIAWTTAPKYSTAATRTSDVGEYEVSVSCEPKNYIVLHNTPGTLTITKAPLSIKVNNASMDYCGTFPNYSFTYTGFLNGDDSSSLSSMPSVTTTATATSNAGSYLLTPEGAEAKNYSISYESGLLYVNRRPLVVKPQAVSRYYGDDNPAFVMECNGFVNDETPDVFQIQPYMTTNATVKSPVGTYRISIRGGSAQNYVFNYEKGVLTVDKAPLSVQVKDAQKVYGNTNPTFELSYSGLKNNETVPAWDSSPTFSTLADRMSAVGTYPIGVTCVPCNYDIKDIIQGTLTVTKAPLTIKANNAEMEYCGTWPTFSYSYSGFVNGDNSSALTILPTIVTDATPFSSTGTYTITPSGADAGNYAINYVSGSLLIKQRPLTVLAQSASRCYGAPNPAFSVEYIGFVNNETKDVLSIEPTLSTMATIQSPPGTYEIKVDGGQALNYVLNYQNGFLTVTPKEVKASVGEYERPYGQPNPDFEIIYEGLAGNDTENSLTAKPIVRTLATNASKVGTYVLEVAGGYSPNYTFTYGTGALTIVKAEQEFEWEQDLSNLEVGSQIELQASATSGLPVTYTSDNDDIAEIYRAGSKTYLECKSAGSFTIKAVQEGNDNYYSTRRINKKVTIVGEGDYTPTLIIKQADNGAISTKVTKGSRHVFTIHVENGWRIHSVLFNNQDVTSQLDEDNTYITPAILETSVMNVVFEKDNGTPVTALPSSSIKIQGTSFGARVTGANDGELIQVFTTDGVLQKSVKAHDSVIDIPLSEDIYIIRVGTKTVKLSI